MTKELFFPKNILPYLGDVINWKEILFLDKKTVDKLTKVGLVKKRDQEDRDVDSFIICGEYKIRFHSYHYFISKIEKGSEVLYEYSDKKAAKEKPRINGLQL